MGYSEILCHICGVSFNIGRVRTPSEPRSAAWSRYGKSDYLRGEHYRSKCCRESGCQFTFRRAKDLDIEVTVDTLGRRQLNPRPASRSPPPNREESLTAWDREYQAHLEATFDDESDETYEEAVTAEDDVLEEWESDVEMEDADQDESVEVEADDYMDPSFRHFWLDMFTKDKFAKTHYDRSAYRLEYNSIHEQEDGEPGLSGFKAWHRGAVEDLHETSDQASSMPEERDQMFSMFQADNLNEIGNASDKMILDGNGNEALSKAAVDRSLDPEIIAIRKSYGLPDHPLSIPQNYSRGHLGRRIMRHDIQGLERQPDLGYWAGDSNLVEHIAGPGCQTRDGYNGHKITAEEMKGCLTAQCLVRKPPSNAMLAYEPAVYDEDFEKEGRFFLSGLTDHMPSRDYDNPHVYPARHGCESPDAENTFWQENQSYAMPFHPTCLETFRRVSRLRTGGEDIEGLADWWVLEGDYESFRQFKTEVRDPNVGKCAEQDWNHRDGTEYLVANPAFVPGLARILAQAVVEDESFDVRNGAFDVPNGGPSEARDGFGTLPHELLMLILAHLDSRDIAALRLSSRAFRQSPNTLFRDLLMREKPWLWEIWDTKPYSIWATSTAEELKLNDRKWYLAQKSINDYTTIVSEEMPELKPDMEILKKEYTEALNLQHHHDRLEASLKRKPFFLPPQRTNYYILYTLLTRHLKKDELKGLKNRARIWSDCEAIVGRIGRYRDAGRFPVAEEAIPGLVREAYRRQREERERWEEVRRREREGRGTVLHPAPA